MAETIAKLKPQVTSVRGSFDPHLDRLFKRAFDIFTALSGLLALSPVFLWIAICIKRESPGPVFYRGSRLGKDGRPFGILKFRTMYDVVASYHGPLITAQDDRRITPLGKWLRDTKLNELPQLWNVLIGEMSLVGPRPEDPEIASTWPERARREILSMRPGMTSPASVLYRDEEKLLQGDNVMDTYLKDILPDKLRLDQLYIRHHRFLSDLDIVFWTVLVLLPKLRQQTIATESLYNGLLYRFVKRYFSWFLLDNLITFAAVGLTGVLWRLSGPLNLGIKPALGLAAAMAMIFSLVNSWRGLGRVWWHSANPGYVFDLVLSSGISTLLVATLNWYRPDHPLIPVGMVFVSGLLALLGFISIRYRDRIMNGLITRWSWSRSKRYGIGEQVLIVGAGECGLLAIWLLHRSKLSDVFSVVGMVDDDPAKMGMMINGHRVFGLTNRIPEIVKQEDVGVILFAIETIRPEEQARILNLCHETQARVVLVPDLLTMFRERITQPTHKVIL
jgi:lipopolysaccharide/colanic/teichoic acid biosynthesis glycosyltransferase